MQKCQEIVVSSVKKMLIAPIGAQKSTARDVGFTIGNVTITPAQEFTDVSVDQSPMPVRRILTNAVYNVSVPLAAMNLENLALALGVEFDNNGQAALAHERYYQIWLETDGPVNDSGVKAKREWYLPKVALGGTGEIAFSKTDAQTANLEGILINCPTDGENTNFLQITDSYEGA